MGSRRLTLFVGPLERTAVRLRAVFQEHRVALAEAGIGAPDWNHVRLYAACANADEVGVLRHKRGLDSPLAQETLTVEMKALLAQEVPSMKEHHLVFAAAQLGNLLHNPDEIKRLHGLLTPYFDDITIIAHVDEQARVLAHHYALAILEGRSTTLSQEVNLAAQSDWWRGAIECRTDPLPDFGLFNDVQAPPFWLDYAKFVQHWEAVFGSGNVILRPMAALNGPNAMSEIATCLGVDIGFAPATTARTFAPEPAESLARMRQMNDAMIRFAKARDIFIPYDTKTQIYKAVRVGGDPIAPGSLHQISDHFAPANATLIERFPDLADFLQPDAPTAPWEEADATMGFRATQYLGAFSFAITKQATPLAQKRAERATVLQAAKKFDQMFGKACADQTLLNRVKVNHQMIVSSQFRPHNAMGTVDEEAPMDAYLPTHLNPKKPGSTGNVIVACMKNEAPYIIEWIAHHRSIGFDSFLIYTNDCSDGTDALLTRLQNMGVLEHRTNDNWKGKSPQQHALNRALGEPLVQNADWIAHIDVDEFVNIRTGNGTLQDFFAAAPYATHVAMTWRLFGHNGVTALEDAFVTDQFDTCAPRYCPKPHTAWGFKTLFRNTGAYGKMSCHRPNKLRSGFEDRVKWVNGSAKDITKDTLHNGWRSSKTSVGYDLLQLNHYPLRSAESFLIKRQRGRALHVDRSIGINYWIRMDWSDARDVTIKRNHPRVRDEFDHLLADPKLRAAHDAGFAWHKAKAKELQAIPEFAELYQQATTAELTAEERAAYALALDMEN